MADILYDFNLNKQCKAPMLEEERRGLMMILVVLNIILMILCLYEKFFLNRGYFYENIMRFSEENAELLRETINRRRFGIQLYEDLLHDYDDFDGPKNQNNNDEMPMPHLVFRCKKHHRNGLNHC